MIDVNASLGDLVTADPRRARVLERLGLDYCCGGQRTLAVAATAKGLDAAEVAVELDLPDPEPAPEWQSLPTAALADAIVATHHAYLWDEMEPLRALVDKVASVHGERHAELAAIRMDYHALADELAPHLLKEERILFPEIRALDAGRPAMGPGVVGPIQMMMFEHDAAGEILARLREASGGYTTPADGCASYRSMMERLAILEADLHEHIHKENNVLFPKALAQAELAAGM